MSKIKPSDVSRQFKHDPYETLKFCADLLEDINEHNLSGALSALNVNDHDLATEFIKLDKQQADAGELTGPLRHWRNELLDNLKKAEEEAEEEEEAEDDGEEGEEE